MAKNPDLHLERLRTGQLQHQLAVQQAALGTIKQTISLKELYGRFIAVLGRDDVNLDWPIGKIVRGGAGAVFDLALELMGSDQFKPDGLALDKKDVLACKKVGDILKLILKWYEAHGWVVD
jgi:hypothetical protein